MSSELLRLLNAAIGRTAIIEGRRIRIVDVLAEGPSLVLEDRDQEAVVQTDLHGNAQRRVPQTATIPLTSTVRKGLHPIVESLLTLTERDELTRLLSRSQASRPD